MHILLFGATGMVGRDVLRECLLDPEVARVVAIGRAAVGEEHGKLREVVRADLTDYSGLDLRGFDACFFCLGVSSAGMTEEAYRRVTYDITIAAAEALVQVNPDMTFVYVSGAGTDGTEQGRTMWARVKGATENALLRMPFRRVYLFRPALIQPMHGITSKTRSYRVFYAIARPLMPLLKRLLPKSVTTTEQVGRAMLAVAKRGAPKQILENEDIDRLR